jgi:hypothetical protein
MLCVVVASKLMTTGEVCAMANGGSRRETARDLSAVIDSMYQRPQKAFLRCWMGLKTLKG